MTDVALWIIFAALIALGPVLSAGLVGLMIGALFLGPLADRIGRKKIVIASTLAFGLGTLVTAWVNDVNALLVMRLLTGLGLGMCLAYQGA